MPDLGIKIHAAVQAMRDGTDEQAVRSLLDLATEQPDAVIEHLVGLIDDIEPFGPSTPVAALDRLPPPELARAATDLVRAGDSAGLWHLSGASYDGLVALLIGTIATSDRSGIGDASRFE